ncbi:hypothetical protein POX_u09937 [Penicillium oxalicum]|nr:hypothetical protein POX_u09937 [Penicillium oxalicum]
MSEIYFSPGPTQLSRPSTQTCPPPPSGIPSPTEPPLAAPHPSPQGPGQGRPLPVAAPLTPMGGRPQESPSTGESKRESLGLAPGVRVRSPPRARPFVRVWAAPTTISISIPPPLAPTTLHPPGQLASPPAATSLSPAPPGRRGTAAIRGPSAAAAGQGDHRRACARAPVGMPAGGHRHGITAGAFRLAQSVPPGCLPPGPTALPAVRDPPSWPTFQPGAAGPVASRLSTYSPTPFGGQKCQQALICTKVAGRDILHYGGADLVKIVREVNWRVHSSPSVHCPREWPDPLGGGGPHEGGAWPAARRSSRPFRWRPSQAQTGEFGQAPKPADRERTADGNEGRRMAKERASRGQRDRDSKGVVKERVRRKKSGPQTGELGYGEKHHNTAKARRRKLANWSWTQGPPFSYAPQTRKLASLPPHPGRVVARLVSFDLPKSPPPTGESASQCGDRPSGQPSSTTAPLQAPGAAGPVDGEQQGYLTAYTTRLVTSVVCRGSIPARGDIAIRQPALGGFSPGAVASLLRCVARRPIRIQLRRAGQNRRVPARILT